MSDKKEWIKLHRQLQDCWVWQEKPFSKGQAWVDLLLLTNHADKKTLFDGELIVVGKGQYLTSVRKLADRWGWGKDKCLKFLKLLESDDMIVKSADSKKTLVTIVNYSNYQDMVSEEQTDNRQLTDSEQTDSRHRQATNKNIKNDKNEKNILNNNVENETYLKERKEIIEYLNQKLNSNYRHGANKTKECINARLKEGYTVDDFKTVIDKKYDDWFNNDKMREFLRPSTLFSPKFEEYLNQQGKRDSNGSNGTSEEDRAIEESYNPYNYF